MAGGAWCLGKSVGREWHQVQAHHWKQTLPGKHLTFLCNADSLKKAQHDENLFDHTEMMRIQVNPVKEDVLHHTFILLVFCFCFFFFHSFICSLIHTSYDRTLVFAPQTRGSVAEWSACPTRSPAVPGSSPALATTWICFSVAPSSNPRPRL